jgi:CheY-like chemotaxis protein
LVVEDNDFNRLIVTEFLRRDGHEVVEASDGEAGIARAREGRFDVILMDISMPGMDGLQATAAIRSGGGMNRDCPVIAMTAHALEEDLARFRDGGMGWVLVKPVTRDRLRGVLDRAVPPLTKDAAGPGVLRPEVLEALRQDLGSERAATLIARFRDEADQIGARVQAALAGGADAEDRRQAHRLAGSAAMFGAAALAGLLAEIETGWKTGAALRATQDALQDPLQEGGFAQASSLR